MCKKLTIINNKEIYILLNRQSYNQHPVSISSFFFLNLFLLFLLVFACGKIKQLIHL